MIQDHRNEAAKLRAEITTAKAQVKTLTGQIKHREGRLRRIAADAFSAESEPIDGVTAEVREIVLGGELCEVSPIGICVYSRLGHVISIPGQREMAAWREEHNKHGYPSTGSPATRTNACLFCGAPWKTPP